MKEKIGVRFCGGCNPRYDRGKALEDIKRKAAGNADFEIAQEGVLYDRILVIGGCSNCCASYDQFTSTGGVLKMWDESHIERVLAELGGFDS